MTVPAQATLFNESDANGVTTSFPYQFMIASADDLAVELDGVATTTGFTVTGVGDANGGDIVFSVPPANGVKVLRYLNSKLNRTEDYQQFGDFNAETVDREFDRLWLAMQSLALKLGLCVRAPISSASGGILPDPAANYVIGWNEDGTGFKNFAPVDNTLLAVELASTDPGHGAELVEYQGATVEKALNERHPEIGTYALLRAYAGPVTAFYVRGVANIFDGGFGVFRVDAADTTTADNGGTVLVDALGRRWKREFSGAVSVKWFGAVGNGTTNDRSAVQAALTYAATSKRVVSLASGETYNCAGAALSVATHIVGNGATIKGSLDVAASDVFLRDFNLVSTNALQAIYLHGSVVAPTYWYRQKLENIKITFDSGVATSSSLGVNASNIIDLSIQNCNVQYGIQLVGCTDYIISGNILDGNGYSNDNELIHASLKSNGQIVNNTFIDSLDNFIDLYSAGAKTIVSGNRFLGCKTKTGASIELKVALTDTSNTSSETNGWEEQIIISDNYFGNTQAYSAQFTTAISVFYIDSRASPSFSWADVPRNISIVNNVFDGLDASGLGVGYFAAIYLNTVAGAIIDGNTFRDMDLGASASDLSSCIWVEKCQDVVINANRMSIKNGTGVSLHDACTNITVSNNHILQDLNKSHTPSYGIRITKEGSRPDPTVTYSKFTGNTVYASLSAFRQLYYAAGYMNDCIVSDNVFQEQSDFHNINRCAITGNKFYVGSTRFQALGVGNSTTACAHNTISNNQIESNTTTQKAGMVITKLRGSNINGNTIRNATYGIQAVGTNTAGELDYLNIKDNFSISQTQPNFPTYSSMNASDTALLQAANNQKIT